MSAIADGRNRSQQKYRGELVGIDATTFPYTEKKILFLSSKRNAEGVMVPSGYAATKIKPTIPRFRKQ